MEQRVSVLFTDWVSSRFNEVHIVHLSIGHISKADGVLGRADIAALIDVGIVTALLVATVVVVSVLAVALIPVWVVGILEAFSPHVVLMTWQRQV